MFEKLMKKSEIACQKAIEFAKKNDWVMACFWKNASVFLEKQAKNLKIGGK